MHQCVKYGRDMSALESLTVARLNRGKLVNLNSEMLENTLSDHGQ